MSSRAAVAARVDIVYRLLLLGLDRSRILEHIGKKYPAWGCSASTIDRYAARARVLIEEQGAIDRPYEFGLSLARKLDLFTRCMNEKDWRTARMVLNDIDDLEGLKAPLEINLNDARRQLVDLMVEEVMREAETATAGAAEAD